MKFNRKRSVEKYDSFIKLNNEKPNIHGKRRFSKGNIHQNININSFSHEFKIDNYFVHKNNFNLIFVINKISYIFQNNNNINNSLSNILLEEYKEKNALIQS